MQKNKPREKSFVDEEFYRVIYRVEPYGCDSLVCVCSCARMCVCVRAIICAVFSQRAEKIYCTEQSNNNDKNDTEL